MNLNKIYQYKLNKLFNSRTPTLYDDELIYYKDENKLEMILALHMQESEPLFLSWWTDLFDFEKVDNTLNENLYERYNIFLLFLRKLPSIFLINTNEYYKEKNLKVIYALNQLRYMENISDKFNYDMDECKTEIINYLACLLGGEEFYGNLFKIENNILFFNIRFNDWVDVKKLIKHIHSLSSAMANSIENKIALEKVKVFHINSIDFIMNKNQTDSYEIPYDDYYLDYVNPDVFMNNYADSNKIFSILVDCVNENQSECNFFISDMIYMNYIYYVIKDNEKEILKLKKYCAKNNKLFFKIIVKIMSLNFHINESSFRGLNLEYYLLNSKKITVGYVN